MGLFEGDAGAAFTLPALGAAPGIFAATALVFFVYIGSEDVADPSEEAKDPPPRPTTGVAAKGGDHLAAGHGLPCRRALRFSGWPTRPSSACAELAPAWAAVLPFEDGMGLPLGA